MTLRKRFLLYLVATHLVFAGVAAWFLWQHRIWLLAVEVFFLVSAFVGYRLLRKLFEPIQLLRSGAQFMNEGDFTTRFRDTGSSDLDELVHVYNHMVDNLREERTRNEEQESFLRRVLEASPSGIVTLDFDGRVAQVNPSAGAMFGRAPDALVGLRLDDVHTEFADALAALQRGDSRVIALGGRRRVKCQRGEFFDRGFPRAFFMMEELSEELRRSEKSAYEKLIRMMSHEVNNTTGSVNSLLESCLRYAEQLEPNDRADFEQALDVSIRRSTHMNQFMKRFADVVRLPPPRRQDTDVRELVQGSLRLFEAEAASKNIQIRTQLDDGAWQVHLDPAQMEQVLLNVFRNALDAIERDGEMRVVGHAQNGRRTLIVEDTGPGFSADVRENLFMPFYTTKQDGQGVGLTLVGEILDAHGFEFSLEASSGEPTRFTIVFG